MDPLWCVMEGHRRISGARPADQPTSVRTMTHEPLSVYIYPHNIYLSADLIVSWSLCNAMPRHATFQTSPWMCHLASKSTKLMTNWSSNVWVTGVTSRCLLCLPIYLFFAWYLIMYLNMYSYRNTTCHSATLCFTQIDTDGCISNYITALIIGLWQIRFPRAI